MCGQSGCCAFRAAHFAVSHERTSVRVLRCAAFHSRIACVRGCVCMCRCILCGQELDALLKDATTIDEPLITLGCGHQFHETCIRGWAIIGKKDSYVVHCFALMICVAHAWGSTVPRARRLRPLHVCASLLFVRGAICISQPFTGVAVCCRCPVCREKVDTATIARSSPWERTSRVWTQWLDTVRYMVVWNPVIILFVHFAAQAAGLDKLAETPPPS